MFSQKSKPLWQSVLTISLAAAVFTAIYKAMDNITVHKFIVADDPLTAAFAYLVVGAWTGLIFSFIFASLLGRRLVDSDFERIKITGVAQPQAVIAGVISAGSTLFLLWGNQYGDPSVLISLGNGAIIYTAIYDVITNQSKLRKIIAPTFLVFGGGFLASYSENLDVTIAGILLVLLLSNGLTALSEIVEQQGVRKSDGVNFFIWRFFWLAVTGTILAIVVSVRRGLLPELLATIQRAIPFILWITLTMFFVFLGIGLKLVAKKQAGVSIVLITVSAQIILGYPITIFGNWISPGLFGIVPSSLSIWIVRAIGAMLIISAIIFLNKDSK